MIFAHITPAGEAAGLTAEKLHDLIEQHERNRVQPVTLSTADWHRVDDDTPQCGAQEAAR